MSEPKPPTSHTTRANRAAAAALASDGLDPADKAVFEERARDAVALRRQQAGVPRDGDVPAPASYAVTPIAYSLEELGTDYYAVNLLSYVTLTTAHEVVELSLETGAEQRHWGSAGLPFTLALADKGWRKALTDDPHLRAGLNVHAGRVVYQAVAEAHGLPYTPVEEALRP